MIDSVFSTKDKEKVLDRYTLKFAEYGHSEQSLGWGPKGRQALRYQVLSSYWNLENKEILDIGAGFGDFFSNARAQRIKKYTGLELVPEFVDKGREIYGSDDLFSLLEHDISSPAPLPDNDITLISGLFNFALLNGENYSFIEDVLTRSFEKCTTGVSANFIVDRVDFRDPVIFYSDPATILSIGLKLSKKVVLQQDYFPFECTLHISKNDSFDPETVIFLEPNL
ncbi:MAG: class I SAM-dependent methyltransferase [Rhodospirillales bacterium]|jgi:SAM-dependent methyltransferase